jgi:hypothetical protein
VRPCGSIARTAEGVISHNTQEPLGPAGPGSDTGLVTALVLGITTACDPACKRGLAVNLAASLARDSGRSLRVCVIDADPLNLDVTTRLAVRGPLLEDFAERVPPAASALGSVHEPPLWVVPSAGAGVGLTGRATERALAELRETFDVIVCDLVDGPAGPIRALAGALGHLDHLLVAMTPEEERVVDATRFLDLFRAAQGRGDIAGGVGIGVVTTGDEGSVSLTPEVVAKALAAAGHRDAHLGAVPQLWGRAVPNLGFGAALGIGELDDAVTALFERLSAVPAAVSSHSS